MVQPEQLDKYKNAFVNIVIIIVALIVSYNIYKSDISTDNSLKAKISEEENKNVELEKIGRMEKKVSVYKKLLSSKETSAVMDDIVGIAQASGVKILSLKPSQGEYRSDYIKSNFDVKISASGYDNLAKFINMLETSDSVYMVESMDIDKKTEVDKSELTANLQISSVAAAVQQ